jgi:hypothetical protein
VVTVTTLDVCADSGSRSWPGRGATIGQIGAVDNGLVAGSSPAGSTTQSWRTETFTANARNAAVLRPFPIRRRSLDRAKAGVGRLSRRESPPRRFPFPLGIHRYS